MNQLIHVELDALLDTRLATLYQINPALIGKAIECGYRNRISDVWSEIGLDVDQDDYNERYRNRTVDTLKLAKPTAIVPMLTDMTASLGRASVEDPRIEKIGIEVNVWPYKLDDETKLAIEEAVSIWVSVDSEVTTVDYDRGSLTPSLIDQQYAAVILYGFNDWLTLHSSTLIDKRIPTVSIIAPALYLNGKPDEVTNDDGSPIEPFAATELALVEYMTLVMKDAIYYSLVEL